MTMLDVARARQRLPAGRASSRAADADRGAAAGRRGPTASSRSSRAATTGPTSRSEPGRVAGRAVGQRRPASPRAGWPPARARGRSTIRVGERVVVARMLGRRRGRAGHRRGARRRAGGGRRHRRFTPVDVGNPHAVVEGDRRSARHRPAARDAPALPAAHERPGRADRRPGRVTARVWERGVGRRGVRHERGRGRRGDARARGANR